jgi:phosphate transport system protein
MKIHLQRELDSLKKNLFHLSSLVEEILEESIQVITRNDEQGMDHIRAKDLEIDRLEVEVEEECLKVLALHQPVAVDLRFLIAALKMNNDLERIGDLAVNIARAQRFLATCENRHLFTDHIMKMSDMARLMLRASLEALMNRDSEKALQVMKDDDEVDAYYYRVIELVKTEMGKGSDKSVELIGWIMVAKHIERVADLATNIAEDTIYMIKGEIVRHGQG